MTMTIHAGDPRDYRSLRPSGKTKVKIDEDHWFQWHLRTSKYDLCPHCHTHDVAYLSQGHRFCFGPCELTYYENETTMQRAMNRASALELVV